MNNNYPNIFSPFTIKGVEFRNRIEVAPMLAFMATPDGLATRDLVEFYRALARTGASIVTVGDSSPNFKEINTKRAQLNLGRDEVIPGLNQIFEGIKRYNAIASIEINNPGHDFNINELSEDKIISYAKDYADAAYRCMLAGFNMVMVHGAHGHMIAQFLSPMTNKRKDKWGGNLENRARFAITVLDSIIEKCGLNLIIEYRISADEKEPDGLKQDEAIAFLKMIQDKIDIVHISAGLMKNIWHTIQPQYLHHMYNVHYAELVKKNIKLPVATVGSIMNLDNAEKILAEGKADIIVLGRPFLADPEIIRKTINGKQQTVRPCVRCNWCNGPGYPIPTRCAVNPITGRGTEFPTEDSIMPARKRKKVIVVGGGPAGMQAALTATKRGHRVILYEMKDHLGGMLENACILPFKKDLKNFLNWLIYQVRNSEIIIKYNIEITAEIITKERPDFLVIAVGAIPSLPDIPGINKPNVYWAGDLDIINKSIGNNTIVVGAGLTGIETALWLAQSNKNVTVIEMLGIDSILKDSSLLVKLYLLEQIQRFKIKVITGHKMTAITESGIHTIDNSGNLKEFQADTILLATGMHPRKNKVNELRNLISFTDVAIIGDCLQPRNIFSAIHEGFNTMVEV